MSKNFFLLCKNGSFLIRPKYNSNDDIQLVDEKSGNVLNVEYDEDYQVFRVKSEDKVALTDLYGKTVLDEEDKEIMVNKPITNKNLLDFLFKVKNDFEMNSVDSDYNDEDEDWDEDEEHEDYYEDDDELFRY